jgi:hypothetical protein
MDLGDHAFAPWRLEREGLTFWTCPHNLLERENTIETRLPSISKMRARWEGRRGGSLDRHSLDMLLTCTEVVLCSV